jgi:elongation factor G
MEQDHQKEGEYKLIEAVAESDEALMEKFFQDSDSITKEEMFNANLIKVCKQC